jgi:hypothetical protein
MRPRQRAAERREDRQRVDDVAKGARADDQDAPAVERARLSRSIGTPGCRRGLIGSAG